MTEENKPPGCPEWCKDHSETQSGELQLHNSRYIVFGEPSSLVMYGAQTVWRGEREPAVIRVDATIAPEGEEHPQLSLHPDQARALSAIIDDAAKSGLKGVRKMSKGLRELAAEITEPEAEEMEAGA